MFELAEHNGKTYLKYVDRKKLLEEQPQRKFDRGLWVEIGHYRDKDIQFYIDANRALGLRVEVDENGTYRALVLKD